MKVDPLISTVDRGKGGRPIFESFEKKFLVPGGSSKYLNNIFFIRKPTFRSNILNLKNIMKKFFWKKQEIFY